MLAGDVYVAITAHDVHIATARGSGHCSFPRNRNIQVCVDPMIARALGIRIQGDDAVASRDLWFGSGVPFIGVLLLLGADALVDDDVNLVVFGCVYVNRTVIIDDMQRRAGWKTLLHLIVIAEALAKKREISTVNIHFVAQRSPIEPGSLGCGEAAANQKDQQQNSACSDAPRPQTSPLCRLVLY